MGDLLFIRLLYYYLSLLSIFNNILYYYLSLFSICNKITRKVAPEVEDVLPLLQNEYWVEVGSLCV